MDRVESSIQATEPLVAAVIVNWNGCQDTLACLGSLSRCRDVRLHIIVVDNGSTDGSVAAIRASFPQVEVLSLPANRHFAAGANAGLYRGQQRGADFLCLLNNDIVVEPEALAKMVRAAQGAADVGIVGARLLHPHDPPGEIVGANCDFRSGAIIEPAPPSDGALDTLAVDYVWGCAMLIRAEALAQIGLLDEGLVAYFEDTDLCLRAAALGWRTVTALQARIHHAGSRSADRRFLQQMYLRGRNWWRCYWRHAPPPDRPSLFLWMWAYRLPHLAWSTLVTVVARKARPRGRPIRLR